MLLLYCLIQTNKVPSVAVNVLCDFFRSPPQSSEVPSFFLPRSHLQADESCRHRFKVLGF